MGFEVSEPGPQSPSNTRLQASYSKCTDTIDSARGWRSLEGPPHRVVRRNADNGTDAIINRKICGKTSLNFFFFFYYQEEKEEPLSLRLCPFTYF